MAPKDQGAQGGQRARRARQQGEHHPAGTGEPRRSCRERTVSWGGEVARRSRSSRPRSPEPLQPPPSLLLEPRQEPRAPRPPSPKKSGPWVPRAGDFVAKSGFPHSAVLSQEPRAGAGGGGNHSPFQQRGQEVEHTGTQAQARLPGPLPAQHPALGPEATTPSLTCQHRKDPLGPGDTGAWEDRVASPCLARSLWCGPGTCRGQGRRGSGPGTVSRGGGPGIRIWGQSIPAGAGRSYQAEATVCTKAQKWGHTGHSPEGNLSGLCSALGTPGLRGAAPGLGGVLTRRDHPTWEPRGLAAGPGVSQAGGQEGRRAPGRHMR